MEKLKERLISVVELTIGAIIAAFAVEEFLVPNGLFDGGITGISMILTKFFPAPLGLMVFLINIPFVILAYKRMGKEFVDGLIYAITVFSIFTGLFSHVKEATDEILLALTYGGVLLGTGVGLVLRGGGCLDGTEVVGAILNRKTSVSVGQVVLIFNVVIFFIAGMVFDPDRGMYSLLMYFITSKVIDIVEVGFESTKSVMIITDKGQILADKILNELGRTVTFLHGEGFVSGTGKDILYCVVTRAEIHELKHLLNEVPGSTFATISEVSEVVGKHIKMD